MSQMSDLDLAIEVYSGASNEELEQVAREYTEASPLKLMFMSINPFDKTATNSAAAIVVLERRRLEQSRSE